jgi:uroporphyrinogen decarboxylase
MRQAGRSLPEFRALRAKHKFMDVVRNPELAAEVTLQPLGRYDLDALVLFSDIVVPLIAMGVGVEIKPGVGPVTDQPFRSEADLGRLRALEPDDVPFVGEAVRLVVAETDVPVIGFAGAPFTVASYLIEGGPSRELAITKELMWSRPDLWHALMERLADIALASLRLQVEAGASAVQLFDSWAGALTPEDYDTFVAPSTRRIMSGLAGLGVPRVLFVRDSAGLLERMSGLADVVSLDHRTHLDQAWEALGGPSEVGVQGNLDPAACLCAWPVVEARVDDVLRRAAGRPGHVFNLGHGVLPQTDPGILAAVVDRVHEQTSTTDG